MLVLLALDLFVFHRKPRAISFREAVAGALFWILLAAALLGEGVRPIQTLGIVLVLSAIVIVQLPGREATDRETAMVDPIE